ncbi:zinc finger protein 831 [Narcine bancroftii]|uniref:zinc finger protein 831 n=1 Tax=Narcine bancroftii TaxID=1343680 RepID=UPI003831C90A
MNVRSNMTAPAGKYNVNRIDKGDGQDSPPPSQSFLLQSHKTVQLSLKDTAPTSTVIVQDVKSNDDSSPSQLPSLQTNRYPLSVEQGFLQNSSTSQQGPPKICYIPLISSSSDIQASQSMTMGHPQVQINKQASLPLPCHTESRLKPPIYCTGVQSSSTKSMLPPSSKSPGFQSIPAAFRLQTPPKGTRFQLTPLASELQPLQHTTELQISPQTSAFQHLPKTPGLHDATQSHNLHLIPKTLGLQTSLHNPSLQSHLPLPRFQLLHLTTELQPSSYTLRLQPPHQILGLQPPHHIPESQTSPSVPTYQLYPQTSGFQISTYTPGLPTPCTSEVQPLHQSQEFQTPLCGKELQLLKNVGQIKVKGQRKYVCNECGRDCGKRSALEKHVRSHTGERPFPCTTCRISFKTQSNLYKHNRTQSHFHNCQLSAELERSNKPELRANSSSASQMKKRCPCESIDQEAKGNCNIHQFVANSTNVSEVKHKEFTNVTQQHTFWSRVHATGKREEHTMDGEKQDNVQVHLGHMGSRHLVLQRQQATYFSKQWVHNSSSSSIQTNESTDSGYFSHSDSPDQPLLSTGSLQSLQRQSTDTNQQLSCVRQSVLGSAMDHVDEQGVHRTPRRMQELEEWISKLISENKAVVDDKHLETVRPRKMLNSKQGSIDLPMPYTFKDSFHFDMKSVLVNKRSRAPSSLSAISNQLTQKFHSLPDQVSSTINCLPVIRSNSVPLSKGNLICNKIASSSSYHLQESQRKSTTMQFVTNSQSHSLDLHPMHHRTLVRQTALEGLPVGGLTVEGPNSIVKIKSCDSKVEKFQKHKCKTLGKDNEQKKLKKFSQAKWLVYGEETFRKKYQEPKRATQSAKPLLPSTEHPHSVTTLGKDTSENSHSRPLATPSACKIPVQKHLSDPLPLGSVKVTTYNMPMCQVQFSQRYMGQHSSKQEFPSSCHNAKETKIQLTPDHAWEVSSNKISDLAEMPNTGEGRGKITSSCAAQEIAGDMVNKHSLHQQSLTASSHKGNDTIPVQKYFSHPKLVRQLSILVPEGKTFQEARSQQENNPSDFSLQQSENGILEFRPGRPPRKKPRLKLAGFGELAEKLESRCGLPAGEVLGESSQLVNAFISDTRFEQCQVTKCIKWKEGGSSVEQSLTPTVFSCFTGPDCSKSLTEQQTAVSTYATLDFQSLSEKKSREREAISQKGFATILQTTGNQLIYASKNLHMGQWPALMSTQAKVPHVQKQDFLPKYQLKWTKKESTIPSCPPS